MCSPSYPAADAAVSRPGGVEERGDGRGSERASEEGFIPGRREGKRGEERRGLDLES